MISEQWIKCVCQWKEAEEVFRLIVERKVSLVKCKWIVTQKVGKSDQGSVGMCSDEKGNKRESPKSKFSLTSSRLSFERRLSRQHVLGRD